MTLKIAARAGMWSSVDEVIRQGVQFAISVALARLLSPHDFGLAAILAFFSQTLIVLIQAGLAAALIRRSDTTLQEESAVFWLNGFAAAGFALLLLLIAPHLARFYESPILQDLMPLVAAQVVLSALGAVPAAVLTRSLRFDLLAKAGALSTVVSGVLGIAAAALDAGVWALTIQLSSASAINTASIWIMSGWRPVTDCDWGRLKPAAKFAVWVSLSGAIDVIFTQGIAVFLGKFYGVRELGLYTKAQGMQLIPSNAVSSIISKVALPLLSSRLDDPLALKNGMQSAIRVAMLINVPALAGLAVTSDLALEVIFGRQWLSAAPMLTVLALGGTLYPIHVINLQLLLAQGESRAYFFIEVAKKTLGIACLVAGSLFGMMGLAYSQLALAVLALWVNTYSTRRTIDYGLLKQFTDTSDVWFATLAMITGVLILKACMSFSPAVQLLVLVMAGALIYTAMGLILRTQSFRQGAVTFMSILPVRVAVFCHSISFPQKLQ
jgi:O-antigen/teichoic acid export membrane protein